MAEETPTGGAPPEDKTDLKPDETVEAKADTSPAPAEAEAKAETAAPVEAKAEPAPETPAPAQERQVDDAPTVKVAETGAPVGPGVQIEVVGRSDVGLVREHNEDSYLVVRLDDASRDAAALRTHGLGDKGTLCVVCDGMGGA